MRYELRIGKFGQYFRDTAVGAGGYDMPLEHVLSRLNQEDARRKQKVETLEAALKPFAALGSMWPTPEDNLTVVAHLHVNSQYEAHLGTEDFRRASAALSE